MYKKEIKEKSFNELATVHETEFPELELILEKLQNEVNRYNSIVNETRQKLQTILRYNEPMNESVKEKEREPESVTEDINRWLFRLKELNDMAEMNLRHLHKIV